MCSPSTFTVNDNPPVALWTPANLNGKLEPKRFDAVRQLLEGCLIEIFSRLIFVANDSVNTNDASTTVSERAF
jgi:hypothetical protein